MAKKFNIKQLMNEESKNATTVITFEIENIPIENIVPSQNNKYGIRDIEELASSIEELGLLHNLVVKAANENRLYEIISGERRYRACKLLFENGNSQFTHIPCKVENAVEDIITELKLIHANAMSRVLNDAEKVYQAGRINEILKKLKKDGYEFKGRMRSVVAELLDVSDAQAGRMIKMDKDLIDKVKEELQAGNIGITAAYEISTLDEEAQLNALQELKKTSQIDIEAHELTKPSLNTTSFPKKDQRAIVSLFEKSGINIYNDNNNLRSPTELGQDIYNFLGLSE